MALRTNLILVLLLVCLADVFHKQILFTYLTTLSIALFNVLFYIPRLWLQHATTLDNPRSYAMVLSVFAVNGWVAIGPERFADMRDRFFDSLRQKMEKEEVEVRSGNEKAKSDKTEHEKGGDEGMAWYIWRRTTEGVFIAMLGAVAGVAIWKMERNRDEFFALLGRVIRSYKA